MAGPSLLRQRGIMALVTGNLALTGAFFADNQAKHKSTYEEMEARLDEVEGTLRGHIGLIEDSLKRIEDRQMGKQDIKGGWGQGMSAEAAESYGKRGKDERAK